MFQAICLGDIIFHPLQVAQSRFILQNRLPNFFIYKSFFHFLKKLSKKPKELYSGW